MIYSDKRFWGGKSFEDYMDSRRKDRVERAVFIAALVLMGFIALNVLAVMIGGVL